MVRVSIMGLFEKKEKGSIMKNGWAKLAY